MLTRLAFMIRVRHPEQVRLAFIWSRMLIVDEMSVKGRSSILQLGFEDFLEVIVRFAHIKAMPTEAELTESGLPHAGEFLAALSENPEAEAAFHDERTHEMCEKCDQPIEWKVRQFVLWLLFRARGGIGDPEAELSKKEASRFQKGMVQAASRAEREARSPGSSSPGCMDSEDEVELRRDEKTAPQAHAPPACAPPEDEAPADRVLHTTSDAAEQLAWT